MFKTHFKFTFVLFLAFSLNQADADLIHDGSFESLPAINGIVANPNPARAGQTFQGSVFDDPVGVNSGWFLQPIPGSVSGGSVDIVRDSVGFGGDATQNIQFGDAALDLIGTPGSGALNQIVETFSGQPLILEFYLSTNQGDSQLLDREVQVFWDGEIVFTATDIPGAGEFRQYSVELEGNGSTGQLGFLALETTGSLFEGIAPGIVPPEGIIINPREPIFGPLLDQVSLTAVPEPTTGGFVFFTMLLSALRRYRAN